MSGEELGEGHSKLPWRATENGFFVETKDGLLVCDTDSVPDHRVRTCQANAHFIVTAVNSHEKLLACRDALRALLGGDEKMQVGIGGNPIYVEEFLASARAALSASDEASQ